MGGVRTALYNYLFAKQHDGDFLLRIEDTDQKRFVPGAEEYIMESLQWCGIHWDEGPLKGGGYGPYRQSERKDIYHRYARELIDSGHAYYAFDTPDELESMRQRLGAEKQVNPQYDSRTRMTMNNSLTMPADETQRRIASGEAYVVRIKTPENEEVVVDDMIRGKVKVSSGLLDDKVLFKSDGMPTYHLANVVDDHLMQITHVIRGEEWLPSAPLHVLLYRFLGWESSMPRFAHLPLLLKPDGPGKLSKRDGDRLGFPVFPLEWTDPSGGGTSPGYRESGYFPEAFVNMLALLGWNPGTEQEIFSMDELVRAFSPERVGKSGARFDPAKARWFNHHYLQKVPLHDLANHFEQELDKRQVKAGREKILKVVDLLRERVSFVHELWDEAAFLFQRPESYDSKFAAKRWKDDAGAILTALTDKLVSTDPFDPPALEKSLREFMDEQGVGAGKIMPILRLALVGAGKGPDVKEIMALLGKEEVADRISLAVKKLG